MGGGGDGGLRSPLITNIDYVLTGGSEDSVLTINAPLILNMREIIFFCGQIAFWAISRDILRGPRLFNLGVKKVEAPSKYPEKWPIK